MNASTSASVAPDLRMKSTVASTYPQRGGEGADGYRQPPNLRDWASFGSVSCRSQRTLCQESPAPACHYQPTSLATPAQGGTRHSLEPRAWRRGKPRHRVSDIGPPPLMAASSSGS